VRVRPILSGDFKAYDGTRDSFALLENQIKMPNGQQIELEMNNSSHLFNFDAIFGKQSTQTEVYDEVTHLIKSFLDGNNVCIFSYG